MHSRTHMPSRSALLTSAKYRTRQVVWSCIRSITAWCSAHPQLCYWVLAIGSLSWALSAGAVHITVDDWRYPWSSLHQDDAANPISGSTYVLWQLRLPRIIFAWLVGAALGAAGALAQGLFRNPLADPGLLGVSSGAACAVALTIVFFSGLVWPDFLPERLHHWLAPFMLPLAAFAGALGVCLGLDRLARWLTADSMSGLLLTGIALNALAASVIGLCTYLANDEQLRNLTFWTLGSLANGRWSVVAFLTILLAVGVWQIRRLNEAMNALALGEAVAQHIGVNVRSLRKQVVWLIAVLCGFAVAWCGMIGFIGLVAPHLARLLLGPDQRRVVPWAMALGGLLLLLADTAARSVAIPAEIPVGVFTALIGAPFFIALLAGARRRTAP